jgi:Cof subfamily protein (haloacid dehalogenase superfamily)
MKYKMIAMDMDGTLLNSSKEVTKRSKEILKRAEDLGVKLVICTGRIFTSARVYAKFIGTKAPIVASNGAYIREKDRDEIIFQKPMKNSELYEIVKMIKEYGFYPHLFTPDTIYSEKLVFSSKAYTKWNETLPKEDRIKVEIVENLNDVIDKNNNEILKAVVISEDTDKLSELRQRIDNKMDVSIVSSLYNNFEVMSKGISKGNAVRILADYYKITKDEVICIGDSENDMSMLEYAGLGIAMGNATDEIKSIADYITSTNDEDGVAQAIEKFILR